MGNNLPNVSEMKKKIDSEHEINYKNKINNILSNCNKYVVYNEVKEDLINHLKNGINWEKGYYYYGTSFIVDKYAHLTREKMAECLRYEIQKYGYLVRIEKIPIAGDVKAENPYHKLIINLPMTLK
jgi:uncharacterized protein (DUF433 family)